MQWSDNLGIVAHQQRFPPPVVGLFLELDSRFFSAHLQRIRIEQAKVEVQHKRAPPGDELRRLFADIHFLTIAAAGVDNLLRKGLIPALRQNELCDQAEQLEAVVARFASQLKELTDRRNDLEHIYDRLASRADEYLRDLGNLRGDSYSIGGTTVDLSPTALRFIDELWDDIRNWLLRLPVRS